MHALTITILALTLGSISAQVTQDTLQTIQDPVRMPRAQAMNELSCMCKCACPDPTGTNCHCPCSCQVPMTVCLPGFVKVCPEKIDGCPAEEVTFCRKEAAEGRKNIKKWLSLAGQGLSRQSESAIETRGLKAEFKQTVACKNGIPKFKCTFKIDYEPYKGVKWIKPSGCNHRKNFDNCTVEFDTEEGCKITAKIKNRKSQVITVGKIHLDCPVTTPDPFATTVITTQKPTTTVHPFSHAGENITVIGDGCSCVPEFLMAMGTTAPSMGVDERGKPKPSKPSKPSKPEEPPANMTLIRNNIEREVRCLGVPRFNCTFVFRTDEYCEKVYKMEARQCDHRRQVDQCEVELNTHIGCKLIIKITNIGEKMKVNKKMQISGGLTRTKGFLENCVCIAPALV